MTRSASRTDAFYGCLLGCAVGDSLGLPTEGLSRRRTAKFLKRPIRQALMGPVGMCSDDTEHLFLTAQALLKSGGDPDEFAEALARRIRIWFLALPAGVGWATARACIRLCLGFPPSRSGVRSAGNGPAMRAPLLGVYAAGKPELQRALVDTSSRITHTDPDALIGARCVAALADGLSSGDAPLDVLRKVQNMVDLPEQWKEWFSLVDSGLHKETSVPDMAEQLGLANGVSGYICHTVPMVVFAVLRHLDEPITGLEELISCGGDTDTTAAIAGAVFGARHGPSVFPQPIVSAIKNGPMSMPVLKRAALALADGQQQTVRWTWPMVPCRNFFFLVIVLCHGFRRLFPPY